MDRPVLHVVIKQDYQLQAGCIVMNKPKLKLNSNLLGMQCARVNIS